MSDPILEVCDVSLSFGGVHALKSVSLSVQPGERVGLIGPNGAGKTTLVKCIAGDSIPDSGRVEFEGRSMLKQSMVARSRQGIARTFQNLELFDSMTVRENVLVALDSQARAWPDRRHRHKRVDEVLDRFGMLQSGDAVVGLLPYGIRKLTELSRAVVNNPRLILLDEPVAGLADTESFIDTVIDTLDEMGCPALLIEHDMATIERICDRVYVLDAGTIIAEGTYAEVSSHLRVIEAYLGSSE
jgi:ABC-type branched-subunit amino acid transport system ATPase component